MLMSPDSSSAEVDSRPQPQMQCGPIQMIQVPECTQSHGGPQKIQSVAQLQQQQQQQQQQHHIIHVDYNKKLGINENGFKISHQQPTTVFHQKPSVIQQKSDEDLNLGKFEPKTQNKFFFRSNLKFYFPCRYGR